VTDFPNDERRLLAPVVPEDWLIALATALVAFLLLGVVPRLFW
jgi:putative exporter of polyketide antibiotics